MAPTANEIREWGREHGFPDLGARGNVPNDVRAAYDAAHPGPNGSGDAGGSGGPDYPDEEFDTLFVDPPDEEFDERLMRESAPRRPKAGARSRPGGGGTRGPGWFGRGGGKKKPGAKKKPRVSTEELLGGLWRGLAKLAAPLPPLSRTLRIQAPVAGAILDDAVKDTVTDTLLQPLAALAGQGKVVSALLGPPLIVTALSLHVQQRAQMTPPQDPNPFFVSAGVEALRSSLMAWMEVSGPKFEEALRREREFEGKYGARVDDLITFLLAPPAATQEEALAEDDMIRRAQGIVVDA